VSFVGTLRGRTRVGAAGGLVQTSAESDGWPSREGWQLIALIFFGFSVSAVVSFAAVWLVVGTAAIVVVPLSVSMIVLTATAALAAGLDIYAATQKQLSPAGPRRQTPKSLLYSRTHPRLAVLLWGLDTGTAVSTFRVSATTWVVFLAAALGLTPAWTGIAYALGFGLPLVAALAWPLDDPKMSSSGTLKLAGTLHANVQNVQFLCAALTGSAAALIYVGL